MNYKIIIKIKIIKKMMMMMVINVEMVNYDKIMIWMDDHVC